MADFLVSVASEIIGGLLAILCAVVGAKIATSATRKQSRRKELLEAYADLFASYYALVADEVSEKNSVQFMASIEKCRMLCSRQADKIIAELAPLFTSNPIPLGKMSMLISQLREAARKDLSHIGP